MISDKVASRWCLSHFCSLWQAEAWPWREPENIFLQLLFCLTPRAASEMSPLPPVIRPYWLKRASSWDDTSWFLTQAPTRAGWRMRASQALQPVTWGAGTPARRIQAHVGVLNAVLISEPWPLQIQFVFFFFINWGNFSLHWAFR